ncbi:MAG: SufE family protein, partial [Bacteroidales bacterium]|nr:SufE family protein [Bacteroidales bacterium]
MTIAEQENKIIQEFSLFDDWMDKYNYLIELGRELPALDEKFKTDRYLISGCQSRVWLMAEQEGERILFKAESDALITKGIVYLLIRALSG